MAKKKENLIAGKRYGESSKVQKSSKVQGKTFESLKCLNFKINPNPYSQPRPGKPSRKRKNDRKNRKKPPIDALGADLESQADAAEASPTRALSSGRYQK